MEKRKVLWEDIVEFSKRKYKLAILLIVIGITGLVLPIIPGLLLLGVGIFILKPEWFEVLRKKINLKR
jgi:uncharacterized protein YqgC (DUF456 family)